MLEGFGEYPHVVGLSVSEPGGCISDGRGNAKSGIVLRKYWPKIGIGILESAVIHYLSFKHWYFCKSAKRNTVMQQVVEDQARKLAIARAFTQAYRANLDRPLPIREARCLAAYYPAICTDIEKGDLIAGRQLYRPLVAFEVELNANNGIEVVSKDSIPRREWTDADKELRAAIGLSSCGFSYDYENLRKIADSLPEGSADRIEIEEIIAFWWEHATRRKYNAAIPEAISDHLGASTGMDLRYANAFCRLCCYSIHHDKLLQLGLPGLRALIAGKRAEATAAGQLNAANLYEGMLLALDVLTDVLKHYERQAREMAAQSEDAAGRDELLALADVLKLNQVRKPATFWEAMQLFWLYNLCAIVPNYGRMDVYLGDFYAHDIDSGIVTEARAKDLMASLWRIVSQIRYRGGPTQPNARIVVGGMGRRNEAHADRFALAAMEVTERLRFPEPNLTLRFYDGQNPELMRRALDMLGRGTVHPTLYNDDVHVPMVETAYRVPRADAEQYLPEGCGEILLDHMGVGSPNNIINYLSGLDLVLHNGFDRDIGEQRGLKLGAPEDFDTFDKLLDAFKKQIDFTNGVLARRHAIEHRVEAENASFLFLSMLTDDCIERGRALFDNGARYLGGVIESFGLTNVADSLHAIRELVYERKRMTLRALVQILDADFEGFEEERRMLLDLPKFGNDDERVDALYMDLRRFVCESANRQGHAAGLHFFLNCNLNPGGGYYRIRTQASADGRRAGENMAFGNAPTAGRDRSGLTSLLNSLALHVGPHAGYVQNVKVTQDLFAPANRPKLEALVNTYFRKGGCQLMVTALHRGDLEDAVQHPERHPNLLVRVAGWTSKFIELPDYAKKEVLERTFYE